MCVYCFQMMTFNSEMWLRLSKMSYEELSNHLFMLTGEAPPPPKYRWMLVWSCIRAEIEENLPPNEENEVEENGNVKDENVWCFRDYQSETSNVVLRVFRVGGFLFMDKTTHKEMGVMAECWEKKERMEEEKYFKNWRWASVEADDVDGLNNVVQKKGDEYEVRMF